VSALVVVLALLAAAIVMFAINKPRLDAVALIMLTALPFTGVLTMGEALAGFSDSNIVLIAALFVIGDGLVRTGVAQRLGDWLIATAGSSEIRLIILLMIVVCGLGATMSSTAVTAIFIPVVLRISQAAGIAAGRLMMPLSMAALISGMTARRHCAQSGRQRRARTPRHRGLSLLQLHAVWAADPRSRHHLHELRASLVVRD
jgi:di/tricarboxylate transporter